MILLFYTCKVSNIKSFQSVYLFKCHFNVVSVSTYLLHLSDYLPAVTFPRHVVRQVCTFTENALIF